jgi:hypothetical protein
MPDQITLYPTPTRLALLADVEALKVADDLDGNTLLDLGPLGARTVTAAIAEFEAAGWVYRIPDGLGWRLTQRGTDVLEGQG